MIIVSLMGGLGNQMFQYAAGRRLAHVHRTDLKLDLSGFDDQTAVDTARKFELPAYNITAGPASAGEIKRYRTSAVMNRFGQFSAMFQPSRRCHIREKHFHFDPDILKLHDDVYLDGYWQCERYFADIEDIIRKEFTAKSEPDAVNKHLAEEIIRSETVAIHVRRGDYISNPKTNQFHGVCTLDYYREAMELFNTRVKHPRFFVFSDDADWARENITSAHPVTFMHHNGPDKAYEDLRLMSLCKHHIIANSSFSWWGAWLCRNPDKTVVAPRVWFRNPAIDTKDLIPGRWVRI